MWGVRTGRTRVITILAASVFLGSLATPVGAYPRPGGTEQIDVTPSGGQTQTDDETFYIHQAISADGRYVAFESSASDLVLGDLNLREDVFMRDRINGTTRLVSVSSNGMQALFLCPPSSENLSTIGSRLPSISASGRYVAFQSIAGNLVEGDNNCHTDVFVRDIKKGTTERVSTATDGTEGDARSFAPAISADGRYVAFQSWAHNLSNESAEDGIIDRIYIHDRKTGTTSKIGEGTAPSMSTDGGHVAYLTSDDRTIVEQQISVYDVEKNKSRVYLDIESDGCGGIGSFYLPSWGGPHALSDDGRYLAFSSRDDCLIPSDGQKDTWPIGQDVFVYDEKTRRVERVSVSSAGEEGVKPAPYPITPHSPVTVSISASGRYVAFDSTYVNLDERYSNTVCATTLCQPYRSFAHDRKTDVTRMISRAADGADPKPPFPQCGLEDDPTRKPDLNLPVLSALGRFVAFSGCGLAPEERVGTDDVHAYVRDAGSDLGVGGLAGQGSDEDPAEICIPDVVCIPPLGVAAANDVRHDIAAAPTGRGANLRRISLAYRPQYDDLFAVIELEHMPPVLPGISPIFYGLRFEVAGKSYEVRATSLLGGTFGLFDCTGSQPLCTKIADLRGGYGTTGMRVVFSLPLDEIGLLDSGSKLKDVEAFSAWGGYFTGATKILDRVRLLR